MEDLKQAPPDFNSSALNQGPSRLQTFDWFLWIVRSVNLTLPVLFDCWQGNVAQTACMSSCKYLATKLREMLLDDEVRTSCRF